MLDSGKIPQPESLADIPHLHFLIAEDDEFQRRWLNVMLTRLGAVHICEAEDGHAALALLQQSDRRIDISFIDLNMPGMATDLACDRARGGRLPQLA
jgi:CheY-like chemotaxis protein